MNKRRNKTYYVIHVHAHQYKQIVYGRTCMVVLYVVLKNSNTMIIDPKTVRSQCARPL